MKAKHQRLLFVMIGLACLAVAAMLILYNLREHLVFFYSPSDLLETPPPSDKRIRVGGLVSEGSLIPSPEGGEKIQFVLTDMKNSVTVRYDGMLPGLFREGQGMVAGGYFQADGTFKAEELLAKHDENYMPRDVADAIKESGHWRPEVKEE
ncbi:MAG: cytochrome c-type biosis protein CcmE [Rickettsiales bacterium]|jgi:cytochrome c-type biogenesis protein CcmE|nr:cytochrome c-type biosis protein CcmE [Rickettsiales bacterium]